MKIAVPSNDKKTISEHFGRSKYFMIFGIDEGQIKNKEERINSEVDHSHHDHSALVKILDDCSDIICVNLGMRIYHDITATGIKIHLVDEHDIRKAVELFLEGKLTSAKGRLLCSGGHNPQCH